ncbi:hypothetical protein V7x_47670 [Crateriforma conspicua]|uniref:Uncharacterized protein n=1 Tax=Crateriforma conspicua TaxID=2527996 RepID=A0A5C6FLJ9_9PLAN|nr:hypothetical protein [Crateriforma conspicua]TWU63030.1 hypothetical protein V7x_47670 [Crateriforma conspicua]
MNDRTEDFTTRLRDTTEDAASIVRQMLAHYRAQGQPVELFEAMKMATRLELGLPAVATSEEGQHSPETERRLEDGLLRGCREAGAMLIQQGRVMEGWMYLRPTGDRELVRRLMSSVDVDDDNYDALIQVLVHEAIDVGRGYELVLEHQGTCNSITMYEQTIAGMPLAERQAAAEKLLLHFYNELTELVRQDIQGRTKDSSSAPDAGQLASKSLGQLLQENPDLLAGGGYHLDTTHLASTVKIASVLTDPRQLEMALELTNYGSKLNSQFQYPGDEPFAEFYPMYRAFYRTLLGHDVPDNLRLFARKAETVDPTVHGTGAIETYAELLARSDQPAKALSVMIDKMPAEIPLQTYITRLIELLGDVPADQSAVAEKRLRDHCLDRSDLLAYAAVAGRSRSENASAME